MPCNIDLLHASVSMFETVFSECDGDTKALQMYFSDTKYNIADLICSAGD